MGSRDEAAVTEKEDLKVKTKIIGEEQQFCLHLVDKGARDTVVW